MTKKKIRALAALALMLTALAACRLRARPESKPVEVEPGAGPGHEVSIDKPVIYLHGYDNEDVEVALEFSGTVTCSYPALEGNKWKVTAKKDGTLIGKDGREYEYLYWEGRAEAEFLFEKGFCVKGSETAKFLEKELEKLGLDRRETNDFITYWLPFMEGNKYNVVSFQTKAYSNVAKLTITPKPDKMFRVFMAFYPSDEPVELPEQNFSVPSRTGKIAVEWGGTEVNPSTKEAIDYIDKLNEAAKRSETIDEDAQAPEQSAKRQGAVDGNWITLDISDPNSALLLQQEQMLYVQRQALGIQQPASLSGQAGSASAGGREFTDKNGSKTTFTDAEWKKLQSVWAYTGAADDMIARHTVGELRQILRTM